MKYFLLIFLFIPIIMANKCQKNSKKSEDKSQPIKVLIVNKEFSAITAKKDCKIKEAALNDSIVSIVFSYSGCKEDDFDLIFNGNYLKSFPPKATLFLLKKSNTNCDQSIEKEMKFNISPVKYPGSKTLVIQLPDYDPKLIYNY